MDRQMESQHFMQTEFYLGNKRITGASLWGVKKLLPGGRTFWKLPWLKPINIFPNPLFYVISKILCRAVQTGSFYFLTPHAL
jgi:hypothetical protein